MRRGDAGGDGLDLLRERRGRRRRRGRPASAAASAAEAAAEAEAEDHRAARAWMHPARHSPRMCWALGEAGPSAAR